MEQPTRATTTLRNIRSKKKISLVLMPIIEASNKALDWINTNQLSIIIKKIVILCYFWLLSAISF
jgi:hypothetical protein